MLIRRVVKLIFWGSCKYMVLRVIFWYSVRNDLWIGGVNVGK